MPGKHIIFHCPEGFRAWRNESESRSVASDSLRHHRLHSPWNSPSLENRTSTLRSDREQEGQRTVWSLRQAALTAGQSGVLSSVRDPEPGGRASCTRGSRQDAEAASAAGGGRPSHPSKARTGPPTRATWSQQCAESSPPLQLGSWRAPVGSDQRRGLSPLRSGARWPGAQGGNVARGAGGQDGPGAQGGKMALDRKSVV